jgi:valyl-tRNA synthetase
VTLDVRCDGAGAAGVKRSTSGFDLVLDVPAAQAEILRKRLEKENEQLEKNIANSNRQLADETFLARAPEHVVESIRQKLAGYEDQLKKNRATLDGLN